jgi:hypothetical protein
MHNYVVLNYEKFQQRNRSELVRDLIDLGLVSMEREQLRVPLPLDVRKKVEVRRGGFATINHRWSTSNSGTVFRRLQEEPEEWYLYHTLYREARVGWDEIPAERIAGQLSNRPDWRVGGFRLRGMLAEGLPP